jgi:hypothetical protein
MRTDRSGASAGGAGAGSRLPRRPRGAAGAGRAREARRPPPGGAWKFLRRRSATIRSRSSCSATRRAIGESSAKSKGSSYPLLRRVRVVAGARQREPVQPREIVLEELLEGGLLAADHPPRQ